MLLTAAVGALLLLLLVTEFIAVVAVGAYAFTLGGSDATGAALSIAAVLLIAGLWWAYASPRSYYDLPPARILVKLALLAAATYSIWMLWGATWGIVFAAAWVAVHLLAESPILPANE